MPAGELIEKSLDGETYQFSRFGAKQSLKLMVRLSKIIGPSLAMAFGAMDPSKVKSGLGMQAFMGIENPGELIGKCITALVERADENEVLAILEELCSANVLCNGAKVNFNSHYEGRLDHLFRVAGAALEVQYGNFYAAVLPPMRAPEQKPTPIQVPQQPIRAM